MGAATADGEDGEDSGLGGRVGEAVGGGAEDGDTNRGHVAMEGESCSDH